MDPLEMAWNVAGNALTASPLALAWAAVLVGGARLYRTHPLPGGAMMAGGALYLATAVLGVLLTPVPALLVDQGDTDLLGLWFLVRTLGFGLVGLIPWVLLVVGVLARRAEPVSPRSGTSTTSA